MPVVSPHCGDEIAPPVLRIRISVRGPARTGHEAAVGRPLASAGPADPWRSGWLVLAVASGGVVPLAAPGGDWNSGFVDGWKLLRLFVVHTASNIGSYYYVSMHCREYGLVLLDLRLGSIRRASASVAIGGVSRSFVSFVRSLANKQGQEGGLRFLEKRGERQAVGQDQGSSRPRSRVHMLYQIPAPHGLPAHAALRAYGRGRREGARGFREGGRKHFFFRGVGRKHLMNLRQPLSQPYIVFLFFFQQGKKRLEGSSTWAEPLELFFIF
ncbi:hypothetical protein SEVIR_4G214550v4 [Setaria viridis]